MNKKLEYIKYKVNYRHASEQMYGEENPLALVDGLSLLCSNKGSNTTKTMSVNITEIGMHDGLHHPPWPHLELVENYLFAFT